LRATCERSRCVVLIIGGVVRFAGMPGEADTGSRISSGKVAGDGVCPTAPSVAAFFQGKTVLVTGATGFIGKVLIEKLIRCCPDIQRIFLLIRAKRGMTPEERLQDLIKGQVRNLFPCKFQSRNYPPVVF